MAVSDAQLQVLIRAQDAASPALKAVGKAMADLDKSGGSGQSAFQKIGAAAGAAVKVLATASVAVAGVGAVLAGVGVRSAISFESAFAGVRKTITATEPEFAALNQSIRDMAKELPATREEIAGVAEAAGQLGISKEALLGFTRTMIDLGEATNLSATDAATQLARLANITGMPQESFDRLGATVVALGNSLATTEAEIVAMGLRLAAAGEQVGLTEAQILGFAGALSSVGIEAESGGTAFSRVMIDISKAVQTGGKELGLFAQVAGMSTGQFAQAFRQDAAGAIITFVEGLDRISSSGGNVFQVLDDLGLGEIRVRDALLRASGASDLFRDSLELGSRAWEENTALTNEAAERYATTEAQLKILRNRVTDVALTLGNALLPALNDAIRRVSPLVDAFGAALPGAIDATKRVMGDVFGPFIQEAATLLETTRNIAGAHGLGMLAAAATAVELRLGEVFGPSTQALFHRVRDAVQTVGEALGAIPRDATGAEGAFDRVARAVEGVSGAVEGTIRFFEASTLALAALNATLAAGATAFALLRAGALAHAVALAATTLATTGLTAAQAALNLVMTANPLGLLVVGLAALAAALITAYKTNEEFRAAVDRAWAALTAAAGAVKDAIVEKFNEVSAFLRSLPERFKADALATGLAIVNGIVQGMNPANIIIAGANLAQAAINAAKARLQEGSPSKVFMEIGADVTEGFALGITEGTQEAVAAVQEVAVATVDAVAAALGIQLTKSRSVIEEAQAGIEADVAAATRAFHRGQELEATRHARKLADLQADAAGAKTAKEREAVQERIVAERENHLRRLEDLEEQHAFRQSEIAFDATETLREASEKQALARGGALAEFTAELDRLDADVLRRSEAIGRTATRAIDDAIAEAGRAIRETVDRADDAIRDLRANLDLSREIRAVRDAFGLDQEEDRLGRDVRREDEDLKDRRQRDLERLQRARSNEDAEARRQLGREQARAETDEEERQLEIRFNQRRDDLKDRRAAEDAERSVREREEDAELARRRKRAAEDRQFRMDQARDLQKFNDDLEDQALRRQIARLGDERDARVRDIKAALQTKEDEVRANEARERELLAESYRLRLDDLKTELLDKLGPLTQQAQGTVDAFLNAVGARAAGVAADLLRVAEMAPRAVEAVTGSEEAREAVREAERIVSGSGSGGGGGGLATAGQRAGGAFAPAPVPAGGGFTTWGAAVASLPHFQQGGTVPGPTGAARLAVVHGGETVLPTHRSGWSGGRGGRGNLTVYLEIDGQTFGRAVAPDVLDEQEALVRLSLRG